MTILRIIYFHENNDIEQYLKISNNILFYKFLPLNKIIIYIKSLNQYYNCSSLDNLDNIKYIYYYLIHLSNNYYLLSSNIKICHFCIFKNNSLQISNIQFYFNVTDIIEEFNNKCAYEELYNLNLNLNSILPKINELYNIIQVNQLLNSL